MIRPKEVSGFVERATFLQIFLFWLSMVTLFGVIFFVLCLINPNLLLDNHEPIPRSALGLLDTVYFSIISATTTGFGDIIPFGIIRIFVTIEVVVGFVIMGIFISKLVSTKQDVMLDELYRISFDDKVNRIRSALYLLRRDCTHCVDRWNIGRFTRDDEKKLWVVFTTFETLLGDAVRLVCRKEKHYFQEIDPLRLELLLQSIDLSITKLLMVIQTLEAKRVVWRTDAVRAGLKSSVEHMHSLTEYYGRRSVSTKTQEKLSATRLLTKKLEEYTA